MTNKCWDGCQWPVDIQVFDYKRTFGCFPGRTDKKGESYLLLVHVHGMSANTGYDKAASGTVCNHLASGEIFNLGLCFYRAFTKGKLIGKNTTLAGKIK